MRYDRLGQSNLEVSRLWLGGMSLGNPSQRPWVATEETSRELIKAAVDAGINVIDTADAYGAGASETVIGSVLEDLGIRDRIVIATKFGISQGKQRWPNQHGYSRKYIIQKCEAALKRLRTDRIDILQTHIWADDTQIEEVADAFDTLIAQGKVLYAGTADIPAWQLARWSSRSRFRGGAGPISTQQHYNAMWRESERSGVPLCKAENIGFVAYSPLARGFLCGSPRDTVRARTDDMITRMYTRPADTKMQSVMERVAREEGVAPAIMALAWVLAQRHVTSAIVGPTDVAQLTALVSQHDFVPSPEAIETISHAYQPRPESGHG
jgi:aryl-alcohol dehydrogenase-like predicted oxidoreductase